MPLPKPNQGEKENKYMSRCISFVKNESPDMPNAQATAMCGNIWRNSQKMDNWTNGLQLSEGTNPKNEIMLFPFGEFSHPEYGKLNFNDKFFNEIIDNYNNNVLHIKPFMDFEHRMGEALAWFNEAPYIKEGIGLFIKPEYTDAGNRLLKEKSYRYFSPWYEDFTDPQSGKEFKNVLRGGSATNIPFLKVMPSILDEETHLNESRNFISIKLNEIYVENKSEVELDQTKVDNSNSDEKSGKVGNENIQEDKMLNELIKLLGLKEDVTEKEVSESIKTLMEKVKLSEESKPENEEKNETIKELSDKLSNTEKKLDETNAKLLDRDCKEVMEKALSEGKFYPKDREYWEKRFLSDPENIKKDIEHMQSVVKLEDEVGSGKETVSKDDPGEQLIAEANKIALEEKIAFDKAYEKAVSNNPKLLEDYNKKYIK